MFFFLLIANKFHEFYENQILSRYRAQKIRPITSFFNNNTHFKICMHNY